MSAYAIFIRKRARDAEELKFYADLVTPLLATSGATVVAAYGALHPLEGAAPEGVVIAWFDTMEAARAFYDSPEHQVALKHRFLGADYRSMIVEGLDG
ncbi:DUF1330 domain-containing protein [Sphingomonas sp. 2R-10]|uniref:DUF1330 domain-containing protein n=1 Tax=Sphingomonas sp. 2R-10 TaxID=3045148 RepID=UPI000F78F3D9|nr:DUF1330 domain-containing protein [Sphingomonas sp. 2R-10]MDJ0276440.1 DUF1330 domain-containing protein [Sphingomonas sp. 2R-10]